MSSLDVAEFVRFVMDYGTERIGLDGDDSTLDATQSGTRPAIVRLTVDMLLAARRAGLSSRESGWLFLLLASQLIGELPPEAIADAVRRARVLTGGRAACRRRTI